MGALAFLLGRLAGMRAQELLRSREQSEASKRGAEAEGLLALADARVRTAEAERDRSRAEAGTRQSELEGLRARLTGAQEEAARWQTRTHLLEEQARATAERDRAAETRLTDLRGLLQQAEARRAALEAELKAERDAGAERLEAAAKAEAERREFLQAARVDMSNSFEKVAASILEDKSKRFTDHNRVNLEQVLAPLRDKLGEFQLKVEGLHQEGLVSRTELRTQIESLRGMNEKLSLDANNLVKALKGSSKQQGDWGEVLLIGMLEEAGLQRGREYRMQESFLTEEGRHARPDIILDLPDEKHLVIDSKVSLTSYTDYCSCEDDASRKDFLDRHARSIRDHIDGLNKKSYQGLHQLNTLDFVVMFVPIEPAYLLAMAHDGSLWQRAWKRDVLLVSPGTLFPVIRTIAHMWQQERQTKNVEEIVKRGGMLHDKLMGAMDSMLEAGRKLAEANKAHETALSRLHGGSGSVVRQAEMLRALGARATRSLPKGMNDTPRDELLGELSGNSGEAFALGNGHEN